MKTAAIHVQFATRTRAAGSAVKRRVGRDTSEGSRICVTDLTIFQADGSTILDGASLTLAPGKVYALFGCNGVGKTTLVRCLADGRLELPKDCRVHVMEQLYDPDGLSSFSNCLDYLATRDEHLIDLRAEIADLEEKMENDASCDADVVGGALDSLYEQEEELSQSQRTRCTEALAAVGFGAKRMARRPGLLSGGWQMRLRVAAAVLCRPQLLILDEPTNFLDLEGIRVLAELVQNVLKRDDSITVVVSHNRAFLEAVSTDTIQMARKGLQLQAVPFGVFLEAARDREAHQNARYEKQQLAVQRFRATIAHIQSDLRSGKTSKGAGAVSSRQVKLELMSIGATNRTESGKKYYQSYSTQAPPLEPVLLEKPPRLSLQVASDATGVVLSLDKATLGYTDVNVLEGVWLSVSMGQRIGLLGKNGAGKSLLLRALAGSVPLRGGARFVAQGVRVFLFSQHIVQELPRELSAIEHLMSNCGVSDVDAARKRLGAVGLSGSLGTARIATLSGGQQARLAFAVMNSFNPHVVLLDEPSSHLDLLTIDVLIECLGAVEAAVVMVTHDEYMHSVCTDLLLVQGKSVRAIEHAE